MIQCTKCGNDTRTSELLTAQGPVMLAGTLATDPQPIVAQVCTACGYIELYAPQPIGDSRHPRVKSEHLVEEMGEGVVPVPSA